MVVLVAAAVVAAACSVGAGNREAGVRGAGDSRAAPSGPTTTEAPEPPGGPEVRVVAVADIACQPELEPTADQCQQSATAKLAASVTPDAVLLAGDLQYDAGELDNFRASFGPTWGRFADRMRAVPGNHEFATPGAAGYFDYLAEAGVDGGERGRGWWRTTIGAWDIYGLVSSCDAVGGCGEGSAQLAWLQDQLAAHPARCTLALWHHARFSSGLHGDDAQVVPLWSALDGAGAELVVSGHDHTYERFAPLTADGNGSAEGMRQLVVGIGGRNLYPIAQVRGFSEARATGRFGVLELTLGRDGYRWRALALGGEVLDEGAGRCR